MDYKRKCEELEFLVKNLYPTMSNYQKEKVEGIFPELSDSEDEKNIKGLIKELEGSLRAANCQNDACGGGHESRIKLLEWGISWLEKQKPVEWSIDDAKCGDVLAYPDGTLAVFNYRLDGLDAGLYMSYLVCSSSEIKYKQTCAIHNATKATKEQIEILFNNLGKSDKWSEEDSELEKAIEDHIESCLYDLDGIAIMGSSQYLTVGDLKDMARHFYHLGKKSHNSTEWSEEDEKMLEIIANHVRNDGRYSSPELAAKYADFLLSIRSQPKQEWSEEDDLIRTEAIYFINEFQKSDRCINENDMQNSVTCENWLKSLKPQSNKQVLSEEDESIRKELIEFIKEVKSYCCPSSEKRQKWAHWLEKQNPVNKVEPKFKVGDWIVYNRDDYSKEIIQIYDIRDCRYYFTDNVHFSWSIKECDEKCHLWTIRDANDGDVLANDAGCIFINAGFEKDNKVTLDCYCYVSVQGIFYEEDHKTGSWLYASHIHPATKEQKDLLFQEMKEGGYEWDAEKKELKKIGQKSVEEVDGAVYGIDGLWHAITILERTLGEVEGYQSDDGILEHKCAITAVRDLAKKQREQKPAEWSEEDENYMEEIISNLKYAAKNRKTCSSGLADECIHWLEIRVKSLRPQPKQEWSDEDEDRKNSILFMLGWNKKEYTNSEDWNNDINWLKSLKPQPHWKPSEAKSEIKNKCPNYSEGYGCSTSPLKQCDTCPDYKLYNHWKPSEEQMDALDKAKNSPANYYNIRLGLQSLYNDLLKL